MKKLRTIISLVLAAVIAFSPVCTSVVFAEEVNVPVVVEEDSVVEAESVAEDISDTDLAVGGDLDTVGGGYVDYDHNVSNSYEQGATSENLTILLRGLSDSNREGTFDAINSIISNVLSDGKRRNLIDSDYIDAEKYNTSADYDANHCWAATASNILWTGGYAQQAINPMTGVAFQSEDEVLTYFTENFTDYAGRPSDAADWFFRGEYSLQNTPNIAHVLKEGTGSLLPDQDPDSYMYSIISNPDAITSLYSLASYGTGVLVKFLIDEVRGVLSDGAHWATVNGVIFDDTQEANKDRFKAIIIADSDSDPVEGPLTNGTTISDILNAKSNQANKYTIYRLTYDLTHDYWCLNDFYNKTAVITHLYGLIDSDKKPQGGTNDANNFLDAINSNVQTSKVPGYVKNAVDRLNESGITGESGEEIYIIVQQPVTKAVDDNPEINILKSFTEKDFEKMENIEALLAYMIKNEKPVFLMNNGITEAGKDYVCYISTANTNLYNLTVDGIELPADAYKLVATKNGMTKLIINKNYLALFEKGIHEVKISVQGSEIPTRFEITIM